MRGSSWPWAPAGLSGGQAGAPGPRQVDSVALGCSDLPGRGGQDALPGTPSPAAASPPPLARGGGRELWSSSSSAHWMCFGFLLFHAMIAEGGLLVLGPQASGGGLLLAPPAASMLPVSQTWLGPALCPRPGRGCCFCSWDFSSPPAAAAGSFSKPPRCFLFSHLQTWLLVTPAFSLSDV